MAPASPGRRPTVQIVAHTLGATALFDVTPKGNQATQLLAEWEQTPAGERPLERNGRGKVFAALTLRGETKGSKIGGKMGVKWDSRDGSNGHQPIASRCDLPL